MTDPELRAQCFEELSVCDAEHRDRIRFLVERKVSLPTVTICLHALIVILFGPTERYDSLSIVADAEDLDASKRYRFDARGSRSPRS